MALYAGKHALVTLITCTLGEEGEIVVPGLEHLAADREDSLGCTASSELAAACEALGVDDHRFLGGPGRWRDSRDDGRADERAIRELLLAGRPHRSHARAGRGHARDAPAGRHHLRRERLLRPPRPHPGAPGHGRRVRSLRRSGLRARPRRAVAAVRSSTTQAIPRARSSSRACRRLPTGASDAGLTRTAVVIDDDIWSRRSIDMADQSQAKVAAMRAHNRRSPSDGMFYAMADGGGRDVLRLRDLPPGARGARPTGPDGKEDDVFAGIGE